MNLAEVFFPCCPALGHVYGRCVSEDFALSRWPICHRFLFFERYSNTRGYIYIYISHNATHLADIKDQYGICIYIWNRKKNVWMWSGAEDRGSVVTLYLKNDCPGEITAVEGRTQWVERFKVNSRLLRRSSTLTSAFRQATRITWRTSRTKLSRWKDENASEYPNTSGIVGETALFEFSPSSKSFARSKSAIWSTFCFQRGPCLHEMDRRIVFLSPESVSSSWIQPNSLNRVTSHWIIRYALSPVTAHQNKWILCSRWDTKPFKKKKEKNKRKQNIKSSSLCFSTMHLPSTSPFHPASFRWTISASPTTNE